MTSTARFPANFGSPAAARRFVARVLARRPQPVRERVTLLVSELATNAVKHARSSFSVSIEETTEDIRIEVRDTGAGRPVVGAPEPRDASGRGLFIVQAMSDDFGIEADRGEKRVWFTVATGRRQARP